MRVKSLAIHAMANRSILVEENPEMVGERTLCSKVNGTIVLNVGEANLLDVELIPPDAIYKVVSLNAAIPLPNLTGEACAFVQVAARENSMFGQKFHGNAPTRSA
jgi:hypothetical protein